jgi:predicted nucleic acid-binding protein
MIFVSNTTPVISLLKIKHLFLLKELFGEIIIPTGVYEELTAKSLFQEEIRQIGNCNFITTQKITNELAIKIIEKESGLDRGESEAIVLTEELHADVLLMDERKGRKIAKKLGLKITGTLGIIVEAKNRQLVQEVKPLLDSLISQNIRISHRLYKEILDYCGEDS